MPKSVVADEQRPKKPHQVNITANLAAGNIRQFYISAYSRGAYENQC
ncbi:MAG: hypothetical protein WAU91_01485 [Desulfatitalea sp.]